MERTFQRTAIGFGAVMLLIIIVQSFHPFSYVARPDPADEESCIGEPITVEFPYNGRTNDPWTCNVQCQDGKQRYILYSNGKATQCQLVPGCNDEGEDKGVTCAPPPAMSTTGN